MVEAIFATGRVGDHLLSGEFGSTIQIPPKGLNTSISLKMAVQESHSTLNYKSEPLSQVGDESGDITHTLLCSLANYDKLLGMFYLTTHQTTINCGNCIISFSKKGIAPTCRKGNNFWFSTMTDSDSHDFIPEFPDIFPAKKITELQPLP